MWLMDHQLNIVVSEEFNNYFVRLPLTESATIINANSLKLDWNTVIPSDKLSFLYGNPPFGGYSIQTKEQKMEVRLVSGLGKIDYVAAWYFKAADYIQDTKIQCAFVSTSSITQGEQATAVWKPLMEKGVRINYYVPSFKWGNDAKGQAAVHCVIIGFSLKKTEPNINQYLIEAPTIFLENRKIPICDVPRMLWGNKPVDGGHLMLTKDERNEMINLEPKTEKYIKQIYGAVEFIHNIERFCLWLVDANPSDLLQIPQILERVKKVKQFRLSSKKKATQNYSEFPTQFMEIRQPDSDYILIPGVSSEKRLYIPMDFISSKVIVNNLVNIIPKASMYHFGVLTSIVHMAWVRSVCGRLKSDYRYSIDIVYNNFPWPTVTQKEIEDISNAANDMLSTRKLFIDSTPADLYHPYLMPKVLRNVHKNLDRVVLKAYKISKNNLSESEIVAKLMRLYQKIVSNKNI
jgi:hypothetical protein